MYIEELIQFDENVLVRCPDKVSRASNLRRYLQDHYCNSVDKIMFIITALREEELTQSQFVYRYPFTNAFIVILLLLAAIGSFAEFQSQTFILAGSYTLACGILIIALIGLNISVYLKVRRRPHSRLIKTLEAYLLEDHL